MGTLARSFQSAIRSLFESLGRSILSALGITVGATAIVLLISIAKGVQADITREVEQLGVNLVLVLPARIEEGSFMAPGLMGISYLSEEDVRSISKVEGVRKVVPLTFVGSGLSYEGKKSPSTLIVATRPAWFEMRATKMSLGRPLKAEDANKPVCVIGSVAAKKLFDGSDVLGEKIDYNGRKYEIVGITQDRGETNSIMSMGSFENVMYIHYEYMRSMQPNMQIDRIIAQTEPTREPKSLVETLDRLLGRRLTRETYSVVTQEDLLKIVFKFMEILTWLLTGLTSIALFVGGVGILAIMLMSVNERAREIGIRKAVGAKRRDIFQQFLFEAVIVASAGGLLGLAVSWAASWILSSNTPIKPLITLDTVILSFGVCIGVGAVFGLVPALRAASRDPVVSLRQE